MTTKQINAIMLEMNRRLALRDFTDFGELTPMLAQMRTFEAQCSPAEWAGYVAFMRTPAQQARLRHMLEEL